MHALVLIINLHTKFQLLSLDHLKIDGGPNFKIGHVTWTTPTCGLFVILNADTHSRITRPVLYGCVAQVQYG